MQNEETSKLEQRYQFHSLIGQGGAGEVYAAWDDHLKRTVAIKRVKTAGLDDSVLANPWQEAIRLAAIRHANIVGVYDMGQDSGVPYIVMEYVQGETVEERVTQRVFTIEEFGDLARQSLEGLVAAHHAGLIHRDLKPSNIMLTVLPSGTFCVKILDFGMAKFVEKPAAQTMNIDGTITGSICWISPEQLNRQPVDGRSDLYSLGCVFYYALTGHRPFDGSSAMEILTAHISHNVVPLETHRPDLPPLVVQWVMSLINLRPEHRYANAMQALVSLNGILMQFQTTTVMLPAGITDAIPPVVPPAMNSQTGYIAGSGTSSASTVRFPAGNMPAAAKQPASEASHTAERKGPSWTTLTLAALTLLCLGALGWRFLEDSIGTGRRVPTAAATVAAVSVPAPAPPLPVAAEAGPKKPATASEPVKIVAAVPASTPSPIPAVSASAIAPVPAVAEAPVETIFRVHGSNTIGAKLLPALIEEFLKLESATQIQRKPGKTVEDISIEAVLAGDKTAKSIEIAAHGSKTAFEGLLAGKCDLGMASRPIKAEEAAAFTAAGLGDPHSPAYEHVLGLDGIAVLINKANPVSGLTKQQIAGIFTGQITDWAQVGGQQGPIHRFARDAKSGTFDTFKSLVLDKAELAADARRFEDSDELSDAVAADPAGIGFAGLPFVRNSKAVAVSESGAAPLVATRFTVATEDYPLSRRLFLYTAANGQNPLTRKFIEFALSDAGQEMVQKFGFVKQTPDSSAVAAPEGAPEDYVRTIDGARRLNLNFRFRSSSLQLDNKALRDVDRIVNLLGQTAFQGKSLLLLGFTDCIGAAKANLKLSRDRAEAIAREFRTRGLTVAAATGFGSSLPVASNDTDAGRDKNRRVEVWMK